MHCETPCAPRRRIACAALAGAATAMALLGCRSLPEYEPKPARFAAHPPRLEDSRGTLPAARSEAVIERLQDSVAASDLLTRHLGYMQAIDPGHVPVLGNRLTLLRDGPATYRAMFAAMRAARHHIHLETYIFGDDEAGLRFAELLLQRRRSGVLVRLIYDAIGSLATPSDFFDRLRAGGIEVVEFNPVHPLRPNARPWRINHRDHRKLLIVDGTTAFTGGINISATYASSPSLPAAASAGAADPIEAGWRDTQIQIEGPAVADFQRLFLETWERQHGPPPPLTGLFPPLPPQGHGIVQAIGSTPADPRSQIYRTLLSVVTHAARSVHLTIAYFAPDPQLLEALTDAARRGVDVRLILPGLSDSSAVFHLGRSYYTPLLRAGVRLYERRGAVMHAKTACVDGVWSTVGSTNLDWRSFLHNDEINAVVLGGEFAAEMEAMFADDLRQSNPIALQRWQQRSLWLKLRERTARLLAYWL